MDTKNSPISLDQFHKHRGEVLEAIAKIFGNNPVIVNIRAKDIGRDNYFHPSEDIATYCTTAECIPFKLWAPGYQPCEVEPQTEWYQKHMIHMANTLLEGTPGVRHNGYYQGTSTLDYTGTPEFKALLELWNGTKYSSLDELRRKIKEQGVLKETICELFMKQPAYVTSGRAGPFWIGSIRAAWLWNSSGDKGYSWHNREFGDYELIEPGDHQLKFNFIPVEEKPVEK